MSEIPPSIETEKRWLAQGLQDGLIRHDTAILIMELLDGKLQAQISQLETESDLLRSQLMKPRLT